MAKERSMKSVVYLLAISASLTMISIACAESGPPPTVTAPTKNAQMKDAATGNVPGLVTSEQHDAIPYRACINARGWVHGRLVCAN
jgi:hypothetical protein